ncbi:TPA: hypothetical protein DIV55_03245 [Patescibacteria group bacterium]|uniref:General stress protein n=1 Tax=Candidatus Gottesmanbacteria bacterium GW2011_GWA1_43_11 TaxID=1618436 RepID=A0A0G1EN46_9BACT|nr:MAG: hypothetical protein UV59_C0019G0036 [Candidatus Gottesmanbacteria bacterium GW2011_GWA1_43_11]HCS78734.1 hypothetical protein [Patescibacteria group bacterium]
MESPQRNNTFWFGMFLGGLLGALLILILGTEKGRKLAAKLQKEGLEFLDDAKDTVGKEVEEKVEVLRNKSAELIEKGKEIEAEIVEAIGEVKADLSEAAVEKVDESLAHIEELQQHGRASTQELRKKLFKNIPRKV